MISPGAYSTSQFFAHLNEAASSLGNLKTCLCTRGTKSKLQHQHQKLASFLNFIPKINNDSNHKKIPTYSLENLPSDWLKNVNVASTKWLHKTDPFPSEWRTSYVSSDSFFLNKHGLPFPLETLCFPLYSQRMSRTRKLFVQNIQKRHNSTYYQPRKDILRLEEMANQMANNPRVQLEYLKAVVNEDPEYVIRRYESGRYASNQEVEKVYLEALDRVDSPSQSYRRHASRMGSRPNPLVLDTDSITQPVKVELVDKETFFSSTFKLLFKSAITIALVMWVFNSFQSKMLNMTQKDVLPDQSEKKFRFEDVKGCHEPKEELEEVVEFLKNPEKFEKLGARLPCGVLLIGPPGTGKTLLARAIAGEADVPFFFVSGSEFDEMFVGVGAARIRKLFAAAKEHSPCIVFIDELDAIGGKRVTNDHQPYSRMTLNQLLVELDGFDQTEGIIVVGATNFPQALDKALTRPGRFDSKVHVPLPDSRGREEILQLYMDKRPLADDVECKSLALGTPGLSGADLENLVNQAALRAASGHSPLVKMEHFEWALEKIQMGRERLSAVIDEKEKENTAYHESGHAIVAIYTEGAKPVHKATVIPRGHALGYILQLPEKEELSMSRRKLIAELDVAMGGRVAEELIYGVDGVSTGASNDMEKASQVARNMVTLYGMSEKVGVVTIDEQKDKISPELQHLIESEVKRLLEEAYTRAKNILHKYSKEHRRLAEALIKYESLNAQEIDLVLKGLPLENR